MTRGLKWLARTALCGMLPVVLGVVGLLMYAPAHASQVCYRYAYNNGLDT